MDWMSLLPKYDPSNWKTLEDYGFSRNMLNIAAFADQKQARDIQNKVNLLKLQDEEEERQGRAQTRSYLERNLPAIFGGNDMGMSQPPQMGQPPMQGQQGMATPSSMGMGQGPDMGQPPAQMPMQAPSPYKDPRVAEIARRIAMQGQQEMGQQPSQTAPQQLFQQPRPDAPKNVYELEGYQHAMKAIKDLETVEYTQFERISKADRQAGIRFWNSRKSLAGQFGPLQPGTGSVDSIEDDDGNVIGYKYEDRNGNTHIIKKEKQEDKDKPLSEVGKTLTDIYGAEALKKMSPEQRRKAFAEQKHEVKDAITIHTGGGEKESWSYVGTDDSGKPLLLNSRNGAMRVGDAPGAGTIKAKPSAGRGNTDRVRAIAESLKGGGTKDRYGYTVGQTVTKNNKTYKYIGDNKWQEQ